MSIQLHGSLKTEEFCFSLLNLLLNLYLYLYLDSSCQLTLRPQSLNFVELPISILLSGCHPPFIRSSGDFCGKKPLQQPSSATSTSSYSRHPATSTNIAPFAGQVQFADRFRSVPPLRISPRKNAFTSATVGASSEAVPPACIEALAFSSGGSPPVSSFSSTPDENAADDDARSDLARVEEEEKLRRNGGEAEWKSKD